MTLKNKITFLAFVLMTNCVSAQILDQSNTGTNNWYTCTTDGQIVGQSFTSGMTGNLASINLDFEIFSCTYANHYKFTTDIIDGGGYGGIVLATDTVTVAVPFTRSLLPINFSNAPSITSGNVYTIRLTPLPHQVCDSIPTPHYVCAHWYESPSNTYPGGVPYLNSAVDSSNSGDKYFNTYVITGNGIFENSFMNKIAIYPNPSSNQITIQVSPNFLGSSYTITDIFGNTVLSGKLSKVNPNINISELSTGMYLFNLNEGYKQAIKLIKE